MSTGRIGTTPVLQVRWSKAPSAGTTSLSGLDDNSVSLVYSVGYEAVYQNGVLLSRGNDYTATNGTTITLTTATVAGDIIEIFANQTIPLTDTYSQTVANSLFVNQATFDAKGDLIAGTADNAYSRLAVGANNTVLTADSSTATGLKWATPSSGGMTLLGTTTLSGASVTFSSIPSTYVSLLLVGENFTNNTADGKFRVDANGAGWIARFAGVVSSGTFWRDADILQTPNTYDRTNNDNGTALQIYNYTSSINYSMPFVWTGQYYANNGGLIGGGIVNASNGPITSLVLSNTGGTWAGGTVSLYGVK